MSKLTSWAAAAGLLLAAAHASAATINLNMESLDVMYDGAANLARDLNSLSTPDGGNQDPAEADKLDTSTFSLDDTVIAQYMKSDAIYGDLLVKNLPGSIPRPDLGSIPPGPVTYVLGDNDSSFGFEWFLKDGSTTLSSLALDFETVVVTLTDTGATAPFITISGTTTQWSQQTLPGGLAFAPGTPLRFSYTAQNTAAAPTDDDAYTVVFGMKGVATISGEAVVPEPSSSILLLGGLGAAVVVTRWRLG